MRPNILVTRRTLIPVLALSLALPALAWTRSHEQLNLQADSKLWVDGTSTIRSFSCKAGQVDATVEAAPNGIAQVAGGEKGVRTVRVVVPAAQLDCGNGTMNEHMRKAIKLEEFPTIAFSMTGYDVAKGGDGVSGTLKGALTLGGVTKAISIPAEAKAEGGALHVTGGYELKMTDYDLTPPSLMFGRIKVRETVNVKFDLLLKS